MSPAREARKNLSVTINNTQSDKHHSKKVSMLVHCIDAVAHYKKYPGKFPPSENTLYTEYKSVGLHASETAEH